MTRTTERVSTKANQRKPGHSHEPYGVKAWRNFKTKSNAQKKS